MSHQVNTTLIDRAYDLLETIDSHPSGCDKALAQALKRNDLEEVQRLVTYIDAELSRNYFFESDAF